MWPDQKRPCHFLQVSSSLTWSRREQHLHLPVVGYIIFFCRKVHIDKLPPKFICVEAGFPSSPVHSVYVGFTVDAHLAVSAAEFSDVCIRHTQIQLRQRESWDSWRSVLGNLDVLYPK